MLKFSLIIFQMLSFVRFSSVDLGYFRQSTDDHHILTHSTLNTVLIVEGLSLLESYFTSSHSSLKEVPVVGNGHGDTSSNPGQD